jgi:hypothetical protein
VTSSAYLFAQDFVDEGLSTVLDRVQTAGLDGVTMAASYHHARDVFPHNPRRKVGYLEGGVAYFQTDPARYGRVEPVRSALAQDQDPLAVLRSAAAERGLRASAWLVVLHNSRLAEAFPDCAPHTVFGDPLLNSLCPANPDVRAYAVALASDVARYGLDAIKLEAVHYLGFDHGGHHERSFVPLSPNTRFLLGLCFCSHCVLAAQTAGVDAERLRATCRERLEAVFASAGGETHEAEVDDDWLRGQADGELSGYARVRQQTVTSLVDEIGRAVRAEAPNTRVVYLDPCGATLGYATGRPTTERTAASIGWRDGIDLAAIAPVADGLGAIGYFADPLRLERELRAYGSLGANLEVILRPMFPDSRSAEELGNKVQVARHAGATDLSFYHYGFMRLESLDWIRAALLRPAPVG